MLLQEDEASHINVYVYEEQDSHLYIHHDIVLSTFPLCIEWINYYPVFASEDGSQPEERPEKGNLIAVGTFSPEIEIWDLDVVDIVEPYFTLGGVDEEASMAASASSSGGKKKKKKKKLAEPKVGSNL